MLSPSNSPNMHVVRQVCIYITLELPVPYLWYRTLSSGNPLMPRHIMVIGNPELFCQRNLGHWWFYSDFLESCVIIQNRCLGRDRNILNTKLWCKALIVLQVYQAMNDIEAILFGISLITKWCLVMAFIVQLLYWSTQITKCFSLYASLVGRWMIHRTSIHSVRWSKMVQTAGKYKCRVDDSTRIH